MPVEIELPRSVEPGRTTAEPDPVKEAAKEAAAAALESEGAEPGNEPQRECSTEITIRLVKPVDDAVSAFVGQPDETYSAYVDLEGSTWLPLPGGDIMLEPDEFEIVEPLGRQDEAAAEIVDAAEQVAVTGDERKPSPLPRTHEEAEARRQRYFSEKSALEEHICALGIEIGRSKETIKSCKKKQEVLLEKLDHLIQSWENPPAFELTPTTSVVGSGGVCDLVTVDQPALNVSPAEHATTPEAPLESYQSVLESEPLSVLRLKDGVVEKLTEAGAETLWNLEMLRKDISDGRKEWPKGIGKAKVTMIEDAILAWCAANSGRWDRLQGANDAAEAAADEERAAAVKESQPSPAVSNDIYDL